MAGPPAKGFVIHQMRTSVIRFSLMLTMVRPARLRVAHSTTHKSYSFLLSISATTSFQISVPDGYIDSIRRWVTPYQDLRQASLLRLICMSQRMGSFITSHVAVDQ